MTLWAHQLNVFLRHRPLYWAQPRHHPQFCQRLLYWMRSMYRVNPQNLMCRKPVIDKKNQSRPNFMFFFTRFFVSLTIKLIFRCLYAMKRVWTASLVEFTFEFHPVTTSVVFQLRLNFGLSQSLCGSSKGIRKLSPRGVRNWKFIKCTLGVTVGLITFKCTAALPVIVNQLSG